MPKYYNRNNWINRGNVTIIPDPWYRRFPILRQVIPYHVGDEIKFNLRFDKSNPKEYSDSHGRHAVYEQFGDSRPECLIFVDEIQQSVKGHTIPIETSVTYKIGSAFDDLPNKTVIFTTTVQSWDTVRTVWFLLIVSALAGGIVSIAVGLFLGLFKIDPAWILSW